MNAFRKVLVYACFAIAAVAYADPPGGGPGGGIVCKPDCDWMKCTGSVCTICNPEGCVVMPNRPN